MAGMFYSLQEASEKFNITEEQLKELISQGKLREFRHGASVLLKVDEIETLMAEMPATGAEVSPAAAEGDEVPIELELAETAEPPDEPGAATSELLEAITEGDIGDAAAPTGDLLEAISEEADAAGEPAEPEMQMEIPDSIGEPTDTAGEFAEAESDLADSANQLSDTESALADTANQLFDAESALADTASELAQVISEPDEEDTDAEQIGVLGETDSEFQLPDDTVAQAAESMAEESLEQIEESVNLDSFGSGSGLLDLSLQADDTSLGGILDEIYTPEGSEDQGSDFAEPGSVMDVAAEADQMLADEDFAPAPTPSLAGPGIVRAYAEPEPDALSNAFGIMLFLPLLAIIYATIVALAGLVGVMPTILAGIKGGILYVTIGLGVASLLILGVGFMLSRPSGQAGAKPKAKKAKPKPKPKPKKAKAGK